MAAEFDRAVWTSETAIYEESYPRLAMLDDVRARLEPGMSREAVVDLLGPPTETPYFADHDLVYWLGQERSGVSVDSAWLVVDFAETGLDRVQVLTD